MTDSLVPQDLAVEISFVHGHVSAVAVIAEILERLPLARLIGKISTIDEELKTRGIASFAWQEFNDKDYPEMIIILGQARAQLVALKMAGIQRKEAERAKRARDAAIPKT